MCDDLATVGYAGVWTFLDDFGGHVIYGDPLKKQKISCEITWNSQMWKNHLSQFGACFVTSVNKKICFEWKKSTKGQLSSIYRSDVQKFQVHVAHPERVKLPNVCVVHKIQAPRTINIHNAITMLVIYEGRIWLRLLTFARSCTASSFRVNRRKLSCKFVKTSWWTSRSDSIVEIK